LSSPISYFRYAEMVFGDKLLNQFNGELAALRHQREMESLGESPGVDRVLDVTVKLAERAGLPPLMGLFRKALKLGQPSVEQMVDNLEFAAYEESRRIWGHLEGQAERQKEFEARLNSHEAQVAYLSACFHGLRTSDPQKHSRLALLAINCIFMDDLKPESLDDMMQAAAELRDADIVMLGKLYELWKPLLERVERAKLATSSSPNFHNEFQNVWHRFGRSLDPAEQLEYRGSFARLQSHGMIQQVMFSNYEVGREPYVLLEGGAKFYERLREIGDSSA
jgi:hypothetical protein